MRSTSWRYRDMRSHAVYVVALGASTPVGRDAWSSAAAVRAGISGFVEHPYMVDSGGQPIRVGMVPWLDVNCTGVDRFEALLLPSVAQAMAALGDTYDGGGRIALVLGLPAQRPGLPDDLDACLRAAILRRWPDRFVAIATFAVGHAAGVVGLHA